MRLICISHWRFPSQKTMTPLILRTCEEFIKRGWEVELWVPNRHNPDDHGQDVFAENNIKTPFRIRRLPVLDLMNTLGKFGFLLMVASFGFVTYVELLRKGKGAVVYTQDMRDTIFPALTGLPCFIEIHDFYESSWKFLNRLVLARVKGLIVTNTIKMQRLAHSYGVPKERMIHQANAVEAAQFEVSLSQAEARAKVELPTDRRIALYAGHLFSWKGVDTLARAAAYLPENIWVYFIGGTPHDQDVIRALIAKEKLPRIVLVPHQPHERIPLYMRAADVLVLPNTAKEEASRLETSPVKLFEYLASGTPVVASDIPSIREIVSEREVQFAIPDDAESFAKAIEKTLTDGGEAAARSAAGKAFARANSWESRAQNIDEFMQKLIVSV